jgi:hypothetical protein
MTIRDRLYDLKREQDAVYERLQAARQDLKTIRSLPASSARDVELKRATEAVEQLESEFNRLRGLISVFKPRPHGGLY